MSDTYTVRDAVQALTDLHRTNITVLEPILVRLMSDPDAVKDRRDAEKLASFRDEAAKTLDAAADYLIKQRPGAERFALGDHGVERQYRRAAHAPDALRAIHKDKF